jgi:hypothetical protein
MRADDWFADLLERVDHNDEAAVEEFIARFGSSSWSWCGTGTTGMSAASNPTVPP